MADYRAYPRNDSVPMLPLDAIRFERAKPHGEARMPDWDYFLSYVSESKVAFVKQLDVVPDANGQVNCEVITIPFK